VIAPAPVAIVAPAPVPPPQVRAPRTPGDPHERFNRRMFRVQQRVDAKFLHPIADGYRDVVPKFLRTAIRHFFSNLSEPVVFLNYLLQLKPGKAAETAGRFIVNSTVGVAGLVDVAKTRSIRLPHRSNGFGDTLGFYGVKPGAYLFLPLVGPTTVRDLFGGQADGLVLPLAVGRPFDRLDYQLARAVLTGLDQRIEADAELKALFDGAVDPYATLRSVYLQDRAGEIAALKSRRRVVAPTDELSDPLADPAASTTAPVPDVADPLADPLVDPAATPASEGVPAAPARR
jgi:phospholipid-binding lipoprotein MlaA